MKTDGRAMDTLDRVGQPGWKARESPPSPPTHHEVEQAFVHLAVPHEVITLPGRAGRKWRFLEER